MYNLPNVLNVFFIGNILKNLSYIVLKVSHYSTSHKKGNLRLICCHLK